jgi:hypothetical protein
MVGVDVSNIVVLVSACEYRPAEAPRSPEAEPDRIVGTANVWVSDIAPHGGDAAGVQFVVNVEWDHPIPIATDITVLDDLPVDVAHVLASCISAVRRSAGRFSSGSRCALTCI